MPTSAVLKANEFGTDLPNLIRSSANAERADRSTNGAVRAPPTKCRLEILRIALFSQRISQ
jgi:hypothetical protein